MQPRIFRASLRMGWQKKSFSFRDPQSVLRQCVKWDGCGRGILVGISTSKNCLGWLESLPKENQSDKQS